MTDKALLTEALGRLEHAAQTAHDYRAQVVAKGQPLLRGLRAFEECCVADCDANHKTIAKLRKRLSE